MKPQAFQPGELRDEYDQIIRAGAYGKKTPFVNSDNSAILDYIINNFDALYAQIPNGRAYVKSVNNITPDSNGNVTVNVGSGGGTGTNITVDSALSSTSTNPVQNKVLYAVLNNKLDKNGTATYAARDSSGNIISSTYARKTDLNSYVKSINNMKPDSAGNVNISSSGGGSNITVDFTLDSTSSNAIANKAVYAALNNKLDKTGTAAAATKATQDSYGNVIVTTYARKSDLSGYVKTINNQEPDANGNINISTGGAGTGTNITVDSTLSSTSNNPIANKAVYAAVNNKLDKNGTAMYASRDSSGNIITDTYAKKSEVSGVVKSVNNIAPDSNGNVTITVSGGGGSGDYLPLTGGTVTGGITATNFQTGTGATSYFQCRKFRGEGDANSYYHAIDFGYSGHDSVDFYEYDPNWNFYKCLTGTKSGAVLVGNINGNGWNGGAQLTGAPTAPTAAVGTNTTQIATTAFVHSAIPTNVSSFTNDAGYLTQHQSLVGYVKTVNNTAPDSNGNVTIAISGGGGVSTSTQNVWTAQQSFDLALLGVEKYKTTYANGNSVKPSSVTAVYNATGSFTLDLTNFSSLLSIGQSLVFTAYIKANADYPLTITNGGTLKYTGNSSDLAITSAGLLLNIFITLDNSGNKTSIVQASKLS
ncbi:hypothetical protein [Phascolarctobacterium succinatutens]|uniref:hypothetical protein n=2 Tax=Phascolarctobacterium succinatutens TaxID=626940 RepID=UPI003077D0E2